MNRKDIFAFLTIIGFILFAVGHWILPIPIPILFVGGIYLGITLGFGIGLIMMIIFGVLFMKQIKNVKEVKKNEM